MSAESRPPDYPDRLPRWKSPEPPGGKVGLVILGTILAVAVVIQFIFAWTLLLTRPVQHHRRPQP
jgi:hypothetical protein